MAGSPPVKALPLLSLASFAGGAALATQASLNARLSVPLKTPLGGASLSFLGGFLALLLLVAVSDLGMTAKAPSGKPLHWWLWVLPGVVGSFYVTMGTFLGPKLGFSLFFVCIVCGQLAGALLIDRFGVLDIPKSELSASKLGSVALVLVGAVLAVVERLQLSGSAGLLVLYILISLLAGTLVSIQVCFTNAFTRRRGTLPHRTALLAFFTGGTIGWTVWGIALAAFPRIRDPDFAATAWWMYFGGPLGASYVLASVAVAPLLGVALFFISVVAGQLVMASLIDGLGLFGQKQIDITPLRIVGVLLVFIGAWAYRYLPSLRAGGARARPVTLAAAAAGKGLERAGNQAASQAASQADYLAEDAGNSFCATGDWSGTSFRRPDEDEGGSGQASHGHDNEMADGVNPIIFRIAPPVPPDAAQDAAHDARALKLV
jgi:transporter family-2 protein